MRKQDNVQRSANVRKARTVADSVRLPKGDVQKSCSHPWSADPSSSSSKDEQFIHVRIRTGVSHADAAVQLAKTKDMIFQSDLG